MSDLAEQQGFAGRSRSGGRWEGTGRDTSSPVVIDRRFEVEPGFPLPGFDQPHAQAFAAATRDQTKSRNLFALVCDPLLAPRRELMSQLPSMAHLPLVVPLAYETVWWPPANARRGVLVLTRPEGERVQAGPRASFRPFDEDALI